MIKNIVTLSLLASLTVAPIQAPQALSLDQQQVGDFIQYMVSKHRFDAADLQATFSAARGHERILEAISRPAESKPWFEYRPIFITQQRIEGGVEFWNSNASTLDSAARHYGIPPEIIVAIIGVETFYGRRTGTYPVLEAVATLAFHFPKRADFFRSELEQFLLLVREEQVDPLSLTGSYAGAMGMPQFISSSYRRYAVDFNNDGKRDIWSDVEDTVGSVANYLAEHGWRRNEPVALNAHVQSSEIEQLVSLGLKPQRSLTELGQSGVTTDAVIDTGVQASVIALQKANSVEYWLGLQNFYVITRYNHSALYAMAVYQLAEEIRELRTSAGS